MPKLMDLGENEIIRRLARFTRERDDVPVGIGDDCAVVTAAGSPFDWLLTTDPVIEGSHFLPDTEGERVGRKAAGRVISDIAAMGGEPLWILINLVGADTTPYERVEAIYRGAAEQAARFGAAIIGGDTARGAALELHVFGVGRVPQHTAVLRSGARPGEFLYVTGALGGSLLGKHLDFVPHVREAAWLRDGRWVTSMMDLSDGLGADLPRLLEASHAGAEIELARVPVSAAAQTLAERDGRTPLDHAVNDGEDFELMFTVPAERAAHFEPAWHATFPDLPCTRMGTITEATQGCIAVDETGVRRAFRAGGFEHFRAGTAPT